MEETAIRKVLKNEFAQLAGLALGLWFFVTNVILPISNIQSALANIQLTLLDMKATNADFNSRITSNSNDILTLKEKLSKNNIK